MMNPTVSVIVPIYNVSRFLPECIESVINQTYDDFELILVDDGSTDDSGDICDNYAKADNRIRVIHKPNGGLTSARNAGLNIATGEWIMHLDGDDWIDSEILKVLVAAGDKQSADIVFGDFLMVSDNDSRPNSALDWLVVGGEFSLKNYISSVWTTAWGSIVRRRIYSQNRIYSPTEITYCEDFHLMVRLCFFANRVVHVSIPLYNYRQRSSSVMHNLNKRTELDEQWAYQDIIRFFKEQNVYADYKTVMNWRVLKSAQELLLNPADLDRFHELYKDGRRDMWSCPFVNTKVKILAWMMTHHLQPLVVAIDKLRMLLGR
ncbi:MAG: glycosyltransferase [Bacteroidales bacterium]|nr:glycosyltransferase [Bacteroidales bacterium]